MSLKPAFTERRYLTTLLFVTSLFMLWGIAITMGDVLNRHFQKVLQISKSESGLVQFSIFGAYAIMGIPAGIFMQKYGYKNGVIFGLVLYAFGAFLFIPAANTSSFLFFRVALFILACGLATLEAVAHPFVAALGDERSSDQRINFAQSFNGLGAFLGPIIGGYFILRTGVVNNLDSVKLLYVTIATVISIIALCFWFVKVPPLQEVHGATNTSPHAHLPDTKIGLFSNRHFIWAVVAQFFNVAAQGGTWAYFINYGNEKLGLSDETAAYFLGISMIGMMLGRFLSTFLMRYIAPNRLLAAYALANIVMCLIITQSLGWISFTALILLNFFFSIMFPTIFSLGLKDLGAHTKRASSFIVMGVAGGAVLPPVMGMIADRDVAQAYYLPIICYFVIFLFGAKLYKVQRAAISN